MKRTTIITITIIAYFCALIGMFIGVDQYIKAKDTRLKMEFHNRINEIFSGRDMFVDISYSGYKVGYERVQIPSRSIKTNDISDKSKIMREEDIDEDTKKLIEKGAKKIQKDWDEKYGNITSMYRTHYKPSDWVSEYDYEDGWTLAVLEHDWDGVYITWVFPYAVGYIRQDYDWLADYAPSVPSAVNTAFEFYTNDEQSKYYDSFEKGCFDRVWSQIHKAENEYYYMAEDENPRMTLSGLPLFEKRPSDNKPHAYQNGFMYNGYFKVFIAASQPRTYTIKKYAWEPDEQDKRNLWLYWAIGLTALMLLIVIPLAIIQRKHNKEKEESLYDKLKRLCNPANFLGSGNYDKEKVDKANEIYKKLLEISPDNREALDKIQLQAISDLGISLINQDKLNELKEKVNPKNFLNPYNAEKVALANELFAILSKEGLTYNELAEVEEKARHL